MKRITLILLAGLLLCGCAAHSYESAYQKWSRASGYTLTLTRRLSVDYDEEGKENEEQTSEETLLMKKEGKNKVYQYSAGEKADAVYYTDGYEYRELMGLKYKNEIGEDSFLQDLGFLPPASDAQAQAADKDGGRVFETDLDLTTGAELLKTVHAESAALLEDEQTRLSEAHYRAETAKGKISAYNYRFILRADGAEQGAYTLTVELEIKADFKKPSFSLPGDLASYNSDLNLKEYEDLSEQEWQKQMILVILQALYNEDGTKSEYYDEYYEDFKNTYGEEFMQYLTEVADMFRG